MHFYQNIPKVSIIVPVYNSESFLRTCLDSIIVQNFRDFELILVNDGSTDSSLDICNEYAKRDLRIKVIDQLNEGVSSARNSGLNTIKGEWVCFIDSDDWVEQTYLETLLPIQNNVDFRIGGYKRIINNLNFKIVRFEKKVYNNFLDFFIYSEKSSLLNSPCFKLFKLSIINDNNLRFDVNHSLGEDHIFTLNYLQFIEDYEVSSDSNYNYRIEEGEESLTSKVIDVEKFENYIDLTHSLRIAIANKHSVCRVKLKQLNKELNKWVVFLIYAVLDSRRIIQTEEKKYLISKLSKKIKVKAGMPSYSFKGEVYNFFILRLLTNRYLDISIKIKVLEKLKTIL